MTLQDDIMGQNVKCDYCGDHIHMPKGKDDPRLDPRLTGWLLERYTDQGDIDICPDCVMALAEPSKTGWLDPYEGKDEHRGWGVMG